MTAHLSDLEKIALSCVEKGDLDLAMKYYEEILSQNPSHEEALNALAILHAQKKDIKKATILFEKIVSINPANSAAFSNIGNCYSELGNLIEAKNYFEKAIEINPGLVDAHYNLANTLAALNQYTEAIISYQRALSLDPNLPHIYNNLGNTYAHLGTYVKAIQCYTLIEQIYSNNANYCYMVGCCHFGLRNFNLAIQWLSKAIELKNTYPDAYNELGRVYSIMGLNEKALKLYLKANEQNPENQVYLHNLVYHYIRMIDFSSAYKCAQRLTSYHEKASALHYLSCIICRWDDLQVMTDYLLNMEELGNLTGWDLLRMTDSAEQQYRFMKRFTNRHFPPNSKLGVIQNKPSNKKIKLGYFSPDFRNHAVMHLSEEIFKMHNRDDFETHAFSFCPRLSVDELKKLTEIFDYVHEVNDLTEFDIALKSRQLGIDIAFDLTGNTRDLRTGVFALRAAPIQINFLGYTCTMGAEYYDYIIVDHVIIPDHLQRFYSEKIIYLKSFMPRKVNQLPSVKTITRAQYNLPPEGFIFCCFNKSLKITPEIFATWMRILKAVYGSYLWFNGVPVDAADNLKLNAKRLGVDENRLIFSSSIPDMTVHLARHRLAGLFLDTYPYNAHTTASDALWSGLPLVTRVGDSFASRVSASLLKAVNLPELITNNLKDYEDLAIRLALNPTELKVVRQKLKDNIKTERLFNMKQYMSEYEGALKKAYLIYQSGQKPEIIDVSNTHVS